MATLAETMVQAALQSSAPENFNNTTQAFASGAAIAQHAEQLSQQREQLQQKKQELFAGKLDKVSSWYETAAKMPDGADKEAFTKNFIPQGIGALGLGDQIHPTVQKMMQANPNMGAYLKAKVQDGSMSYPDMLNALADPAAMAQLAPQVKQFGDEEMIKSTIESNRGALADAYKYAQSEEGKMARTQLISGAKTANTAQTSYQQTVNMLETARGNPAVAQAQKDLYAAKKASSLVNLYGDPNKLSQQQVGMLVNEVGKIASGGVPSMHELDSISPGTLEGSLSKVWGQLSNDPTPANAAAFVNQYQDYAKALSRDARETIAEKYTRVIEAKKGSITPDEYSTLKKQYLAPLNKASEQTYNVGGHTMSESEVRSALSKLPKDSTLIPKLKKILGEQ